MLKYKKPTNTMPEADVQDLAYKLQSTAERKVKLTEKAKATESLRTRSIMRDWFRSDERFNDKKEIETVESLNGEKDAFVRYAYFPVICGHSWQTSVEVKANEEKIHYHGIVRCCNVWGCPVCATRIATIRGEEIKKAYGKHVVRDGKRAILMTLTSQHRISDKLGDLLEKQTKASNALRALVSWKRPRAGWAGFIRSLEITYGKNGWHPHQHILIFVDAKMKDDEFNIYMENLKKAVYKDWARLNLKFGLRGVSEKNGVDVRECSVEDYIAKWGISSEMVATVRKEGSKESKTPFNMLQDGGAENKKLYLDFMEVVRARKMRQLVWSRGMKDLFSIGELTDEELLAKENEEPLEELTTISSGLINHICYQKREAEFYQGMVLIRDEVYRNKNLYDVSDLMSDLGNSMDYQYEPVIKREFEIYRIGYKNASVVTLKGGT